MTPPFSADAPGQEHHPARLPGDSPLPQTPPAGLDYEIVRLVGQGGYGEVWLVRDRTGGFLACKVIYRESFNNDRPYEREYAGIQKFEPVSRANESQVKILHVGRRDTAGYFYYLMELADDAHSGREIDPERYVPKTLRSELVRRGALPLNECIQFGLSLSAAVENLHQNGLIHRDIKPANVIFANGVPKLADIGLVTEADVSISYVGTEGYIPPEGPTSPQADVYGLGKVLYEMSTGLDRQDFPKLPEGFEGLPDRRARLEFNAVVTRACETDLRRRYASARELHADLALLQRGGSVRRRRALRQRWLWAAPAALLLAAALLAAGRGWFTKRPAPGHGPPDLAAQPMSTRLPLPDAQGLAASEAQIRQGLRRELAQGTDASKLRVARTLLLRSTTAQSASEELALLRAAAAIAGDAGDFILAIQAVGKMGERFQMESLPAKIELLTKASRETLTSAACLSLAEACIGTAFEALALDDYARAESLAKLAESPAKEAGTPYIDQELEFLRLELARCRTAYRQVQPFAELLRQQPADPEANLRVGEFLCFIKRDWEAGLPMMAHGNDAALKPVLEMELARKPIQVRDLAGVGDLWWDLAATASEPRQSHFRQRARYWYAKAVAQARTSEKARFRQKLGARIQSGPGPFAQLRLSGRVHGTDHIFINADGIRWLSLRGSLNDRVNYVALGDLQAAGTKTLRNCGPTRLFPEGIDFHSAQLTVDFKNKKRAKASLERAENHVRINLENQSSGPSEWVVTVTFGRASGP